MHAFILKKSLERRLCGQKPHTPCAAPYLQYGRVFFWVCLSLFFMGCAGGNARDAAKQTLESYVSACAMSRTGEAQKWVASNVSQETPCPHVSVAKRLDPAATMVYGAQVGASPLWDLGEGWRIDLRHLMIANSPEGVLTQLRSALKHQDMAAIEALILPEHRPADGMAAYAATHASAWNDLYAAISAVSTPWFELKGQRAVCDVSGVLLTFEVRDGRWYWVGF